MYIRTKDGVYEVEWNSCVEMWCDVKTYKGFILDSMISKVDYKLSENLEELCDCFVMTHYFKETNYTKCEVLKEDKDLMIKAVRLKKQHNEDEDLKNEFNIYGAIWTDKCLICVAKIDNEGKLVLI